jgi:Gpi18-like mannosyltransferase
MQSIKNFFFAPGYSKNMLWECVLFPFLLTRFCWILIAYFVANNYLANPSYAKYFDRGFFLTKIFPIDIFTRWDSAAYFSIIKNGYVPSSDITTVFSNIPFFPLYPYLVKSIGWLGFPLPDGFFLALGVILSNIFFLVAAMLLFKYIIAELKLSIDTAQRTLILLFVFPTSFIFSSFYTESLFLLLAILCFTFAAKENWLAVAFCATLILVTRIQGIIVWGLLIMFYLERKKWNFSKIEKDIIWLVIAPIGLLFHLFHLYTITGYFLAPYSAQAAWGRSESGVISNLAQNLNSTYLDIYKIDLILAIIFIIAGIYILIKWPEKTYGVFVLSLSLIPIASGSLISVSRFLSVIFPVFILMGEKLNRTSTYDLVRATFFVLQIIYFAGWVNYYWIA